MKAFLNRINRGLSKDKDREKDHIHREKVPQLSPLPEWPPHLAQTTPTSVFKPLPELSSRPLPPVDEPTSSSTDSSANPTPTPTGSITRLPTSDVKDDLRILEVTVTTESPRLAGADSAGRNSRKTNNSSNSSNGAHADVQKKVAFLSPPPTPGPSADRPLPSNTPTPGNSGPSKTTVSRFQAAHVKDTRGSTSTAASSRTDVASTMKTAKAGSTRAASSPYPRGYGDGASIHQSLRSGTPYSQMTHASSRILSAQSWSEGAEEDLVSNIGQRERTRQEVLWEIVASEERYVNELLKMKETFIDPLLHPYSASTPASPAFDDFPAESPRESIDHLPIAARFLTPTPFRSESPSRDEHPNIDGESLNSEEEDEAEDRMGATFTSTKKSSTLKHNHPRSPYGNTATRTGGKYGTTVPFPARSHQSLPPPPRTNPMASSTQSLGRQSVHERDLNIPIPSPKPASTAPSRVLQRFKKSSAPAPVGSSGGISSNMLPEDLKKCLEVIEGGILDGHMKLSESLRKRYEDQYPLVRSLADVFVANSHILHGYATFVLHLERALEQVDNALSTAAATKKPKKQDADQWLKVCTYLQQLEHNASEKGETGLAISLSKPFQRLLKYPLLFQNLLFHTDPSTFEYESTLQMVAEVETIVRSIEDEKIQKEERDKTRDVFGRIEGLDKVKQLMMPKPSRVLVEERVVLAVNDSSKPMSPPPSAKPAGAVKGKTSFKRLSDVLQSNSSGIGGKKDQWLVVFNDVVLRCQRTGTTSLPMGSSSNPRSASMPDLQGKNKYGTERRRASQVKPRNLYKFLKIETWAIGDVVQPREGVVSMEDVVRSRQQVHSGVPQPRLVPMPDDVEDEGGDSDDSDRKSKMSFSYWGADKVTLQKPVVKPRTPATSGARRGGPSYGRESSAIAKFGNRMPDAQHAVRPASRRTQTTPTSRQPAQSEDGHAMKATVTRDRPGWNQSTRATVTPVPKNARVRNTSQTSTATRTPTIPAAPIPTAAKLSSPAPSEDSGVGFYKTIMAQNPSLNRLNP
ncbi:Dbl domain-containing protein [Phanerochaete sordida]|uniref:Dbl domain-containing protein n=1 Tax=Phanerochaete sordida TaxID=48140 RepID=A0A9P3LDX5_9APHY|nr:Dbl domain-containing protein [Phanerochaete sordida]